jgi:hypothetical protein
VNPQKGSFMSYNVGSRTVGVQLASEIAAYLEKAMSLGAFSGPLGQMEVNPKVKPLLEAINHVLAGGTVVVDVTKPGDPSTYKQLNEYLNGGLKEANEINKAAGYYVTLVA